VKSKPNLSLKAYKHIGLILSILICTFSLNNNPVFSQTIESAASMQTSSNETSSSSNNDLIMIKTNDTEPTTSTLIVKLLSNNLEDRLQNIGSILNITSKLPQVRNTSFAHLLNQTLTTLHGIPQDADIEKRQIAQDILSSHKDLFEIVFVMPNGDVYFVQPYTIQQALTTTNLAFRDYFQGATKTNAVYLGNVITSAAAGVRESLIAVPVYSLEDNSTLVGVWAGGLDFDVLNEELQSLNLTSLEGNARVVYVDSNGSKIADSDPNNTNPQESFANLTSFKNAIMNGQSGSTVDIVNNREMLVTYQPVNVFNNTCAVLLMQEQQQQPPSSPSPSPSLSNQTINSE
jgi:hypothetical protein